MNAATKSAGIDHSVAYGCRNRRASARRSSCNVLSPTETVRSPFDFKLPSGVGGGVCACCAKLAELNAAMTTAPTATAARRNEPVALSFMASPKLRSRS